MPSVVLLLAVLCTGQGTIAAAAAAAVAFEPPASEPHHLVWGGVNLDIVDSKSSHDDAGSSRYAKKSDQHIDATCCLRCPARTGLTSVQQYWGVSSCEVLCLACYVFDSCSQTAFIMCVFVCVCAVRSPGLDLKFYSTFKIGTQVQCMWRVHVCGMHDFFMKKCLLASTHKNRSYLHCKAASTGTLY